jgi:hypothetical protein
MRNIRLFTLLALLMMAGGVTMQAQEMNEIFVSDTLTIQYLHRIDGGFLAKGYGLEPYRQYMVKFDDEGEALGSVCWLPLDNPTMEYDWQSEFFTRPDGNTGFIYMMRENDAALLYSVSVTDELEMTISQFNWTGLDVRRYDALFEPMAVCCKDGSVIFSYSVDTLFSALTQGIRILKFDTEGNMVAERLFDAAPMQDAYPVFSSPDSLGCCIIMPNPNPPLEEDCHVLDEDLNIAFVKEHINSLSYPKMLMGYMYVSLNPHNNRSYGIGSFNMPAFGGNPAIKQDIFMTAFDDKFNQLAYCLGPATDLNDERALRKAIDYGSDGSVYMCGYMDYGSINNIYITHFDENLNQFGEIYYHDEQRALTPYSLCAYPEGCLVCCAGMNRRTQERENCIYRIKDEVFVGIEEAHKAGFAVAMAYPNPGKDVLNIRTGLKDAWVEVYDMSGRMVYRQEITENVTAINTTDWSNGTYVWKVYAGVSTLRQGSATSGSTTLAETGKWVKE